MHEMSLAMSVMSIVDNEMDSRGKKQLTEIEIEVGEQAGVEFESFTTAMDAVVRSSRFPGARVRIVRRESRAQCLDCGHIFHPDRLFPVCPSCGSGACGITAGREFRVSSITFTD